MHDEILTSKFTTVIIHISRVLCCVGFVAMEDELFRSLRRLEEASTRVFDQLAQGLETPYTTEDMRRDRKEVLAALAHLRAGLDEAILLDLSPSPLEGISGIHMATKTARKEKARLQANIHELRPLSIPSPTTTSTTSSSTTQP